MKMKWTRKKPRKPGYYYIRRYTMQAARVVIIHKTITGTLYGQVIGHPQSFSLSVWDNHQFAGPLPEPPSE